jgi:diguanylate cyclase (GGDEF)-like protein
MSEPKRRQGDQDPDLTRTAYEHLTQRVAKLEEERDAMMLEADTDKLTGLFNLRGLERRTQGRDWGWYIQCDLNGFKSAQDTHADGHHYGNRILVEFAEFLLSISREDELRMRNIIVARTGGDEFTIWAETKKGATRIKDAVRAWQSRDELVDCSAGLGETREAADSTCYINKVDRKEARRKAREETAS